MSGKSKQKCKYWDKCYQKNPQHLASFRHPLDHDPAENDSSRNPSPSVSAGQSASSKNATQSLKPVSSSDTPVLHDSETDEGDTPTVNQAPIVIDADTAPEDVAEDLSEAEETEDNPLASIDSIRPKKYLKDGEILEIQSQSSSATYRIKRTGDHYYCTCPAWRNQGSVPVNARTCKHLKEVLGAEYEDARYKLNGGPITTSTKRKRSSSAVDDGDDDEDAAGSASSSKKAKAVAPKLLLANSWDFVTGKDPTGWWLSEKLDGVRALWDPSRKQFLSRLGNPFTAPDWFIKDLPTHMTLDGELFTGRGQFSQTISTVKTHNSKSWHTVKFHVFDSPSLGTAFESRIETVKKHFAQKPSPNVHIVHHIKCRGRDHALEYLKEVEEEGGEGIMMRMPGSLYEGKRSATLSKVKSFYDAEAEVIGYEKGKGKHTGSVGALKCKMESGKQFKVGTGLSDAERKSPPKIGAIVTYRFQELTNDGVPRFPSYIGVRIDAKKAKDYVFPKKK